MSLARSIGFAFLASLAALGSMGAAAQVYRNVGPDGKVTFSDKPPVDRQAPPQVAPSVAMQSAGAGGGGLPFELRTVSGRYPVTLYTAEGCGPCASARGFLAGRGIPYTEKIVSSNEDAAAFRRLSGEVRVPFLTVGTQQLRGYSETEWSQYLDAAGYPKTSQLPASYRNPPPTPLVAAQQAQSQPDAPAAPQQPSVQLPSTEPRAPGIRF
ncbi:MAG: glutaredoxin [Ramlibacter sp.]|nr:glutaredoxin [Ramlibacter sp.]